jgi:hypothetical protein
MRDLPFKLLVIASAIVFASAYVALEVYLPRILDKASGADKSSSWQPSARPVAALTFALLLLIPVATRLTIGWPRSAFDLFFTAYATSLMTLVLMLSASSSAFQRFAFSQQPVPDGLARRFRFGITFFLILAVASSYLYIQFV